MALKLWSGNAWSSIKKLFHKLEILEIILIDKFGEASQKPRWFTFWIGAYFVWVLAHFYLKHIIGWYNDGADFITVTLLFSCVPFWVENSLKRSQSEAQRLLLVQMEIVANLSMDLKRLFEMHAEKDEAHYLILKKVTTILEEARNTRDGKPDS